MCSEMGAIETPLAGSPYEVRELLFRRIATSRPHKLRDAARLGPQARGYATDYLRKAEDNPPHALRRSSPRESLRMPRARSHIGAPAPMNTNAAPGLSRRRYQSISFGQELRGGRKDILFRIEGTSSRGSEAPRGEVPRRGTGRSNAAR